jgi:hypothetical protein
MTRGGFVVARKAKRNVDGLSATDQLVHPCRHYAMGKGISMPCSAATSTILLMFG